jgi:chromosome segregation ATPase
MEPEERNERLLTLSRQLKIFEEQRAFFIVEISNAEAVAKQLRMRAIEVSHHHQLYESEQSCNAQSILLSRFASRPSTVALSGIQKSERKLELKLNLRELELSIPCLKIELDEWAGLKNKTLLQRDRMAAKLKATPQQYRETAAELRGQLLGILAERRELQIVVGQLEGEASIRLNRLSETNRALRNELSDACDEFSDVKREGDDWERQVQVLRSRLEVDDFGL